MKHVFQSNGSLHEVQSSSRLLTLLAMWAVLLGTGLGLQRSAAQIFPGQGDDSTPSMGVFRVTVDPAFRWLMAPVGALSAYAGYQSVDGKLTSPLVIDNSTTIGRSAPNSRFYTFPVAVGAGSWDTITGYASYSLIPPLWAAAPSPTEEVLTEVKSFILSSVAGTAGQHCPPDPRIPQVPLNWPMVKAGTFAGVPLRSLGMVQEIGVNGPTPPDFPARSFFDIFVEVNLPSLPGTESGVAFPGTGAVLYNDSPLVITNLALTSFPPSVIYIHGETPAVPIKFKVNNPPYWNAGDIFGYLVLAGHGTITNDCNNTPAVNSFLDAVLGPVGTLKPELPVEWPRTNNLCPSAGSTYDSAKGTNSNGQSIDQVAFTNGASIIYARNFSHTNLPNPIPPPTTLNQPVTNVGPNSLVRFEFSSDGNNWNLGQAIGPVAVKITRTPDVGGTQTYDTEMLQLDLVSGPFRIRESPTRQSLGKHTIRPDSGVFRIGSFFDVFLELSVDNGVNWLPANRPIRVQSSPPPLLPLTLKCSSNITVTATSSSGAVVTYTSSASGGCSPPPTLICTPPSGSTFPIGITTVTCMATNACGDTTNCSFLVTVRSGDPCLEPDNGTGTVTLPPQGCAYLSPDEVHMIIDGLPPGTTIELSVIHKDFICKQPGTVCSFNSPTCREAGGALGGEKECADSTLEITLRGTGSLSNFLRQINIPVGFETHVGPRTPGQPVQSFDTEMFRLQGQITGDPDFDLLRITAGNDYGLPSPGHTTLTLQPGGSWAVDSFFDITYRIDFVGRPGGTLGGHSGSTTGTIRMGATPPITPIVLNCSSNITVTATSSAGAVVTYISSASGGCDPPPTVVCNPPSGSTFPIGITTVTCTASDSCGATTNCSFLVTVRSGNPCEEPDNGTGTVTLPPQGCQYLSPNEVHMIIDGLPPGTTIELSAIHRDFICKQPGGPCPADCFTTDDCNPANGATEQFTSTLDLQLHGTGQLAGWDRHIVIPNVDCQSQVGPRTLGAPVQNFDTEMLQIVGQLPPGDPDFDLLRITAGSGFGLPSPGHTTLTRKSNGNWEVDSFFDITYRIDFVGHTGGTLSGHSGSTTGTIRMGATPLGVTPPIVLNCSTNIVVNEMTGGGAFVFFSSTASGGCNPPPTVTCNPPSGSFFSVGTTVVTCFASDGCGNSANCTFKVTVLPEFFNPTNTLPPPKSVYISPALWHVLFNNGIVIRDVRHRFFTQSTPPPPLGATIIESFGSQLDFEVSMNNGATFQPASATADVTVRVTHTDESTAGSIYETEMLSLNLTSGGMMLRESPTLASTGKTTVRTVPGGYMVSSFFDVFIELSLDSGQNWVPAQEAARVEVRNDPRQVPTGTHPTLLLPPPNDAYISPAKWHALFANGIVIRDVRHKLFTQSLPPPPAGGSNTHSFNSTLDLQLSTDGGNTFQSIRVSSPVQVRVRSLGSGNSGMYDTEMTQLDISGGALPPNVRLRESPTLPSRGGTQIDVQPDGTYRHGSFFDIFPEVSIDNGGSWSPTSNGPVRMQLSGQAPEMPASSPNLPITNSPYVSPAQWHAAYANGIYISNVTHRGFTQAFPPPQPGTSQTEGFGSTVDMLVSTDGGRTFVPASCSMTVTVQVISRPGLDSGTTRFFDTEMLALDISGGTLPNNIRLRESPTRASTGRTSIRPDPAGGYRIGSFFDIFPEISTDNGTTWLPSTNPPAMMSPRLRAKKRPFPTPNLPATNSQYVSPRQWHALYANGIIISNVTHKRFLANFPPPPPRTTNIHNFGSQVTFMLSMGPGQPFIPMTANADCTVQVGSSGFQGTEQVFQTEMLALNLSGGSLPAGTMIRESPTRRSTGETRFNTASSGSEISSFFDIFTEVSLDGGATWTPADSPGYMELHLDPGVPPTTIVQPRIQAGVPTFTVQGQSGLRYLLQYKNSLSDLTWTTISIAPGTGQQLTLTDTGSTGTSRRFYRVEVQEDDTQ